MTGPSSNRELETRRILQEALPEYDVDPHIRLANVVKGRIETNKKMAAYEVDFTIRTKDTGAVICVVELDDSTHDNEYGKYRDNQKNKWLAEAKIRIIRIRQPEEARNIRTMIDEAEYVNPDAIKRSYSSKPPPLTRFLPIIASAVTLLVIWLSFNHMMSNQQKHITDLSQQAQRAAAQIKTQQSVLQSIPQAVPQPPPHFERVIVRGKSARECARPDGTLDNYTVRCMQDHEEVVEVK